MTRHAGHDVPIDEVSECHDEYGAYRPVRRISGFGGTEMARLPRIRHRPVRRASPISRALHEARRATRLSATSLARAVGLHPRTVTRWEIGESRPREAQWTRLMAFYARRAPAVAANLAAAVGRELPALPNADDGNRAMQVVALAADALDVAPKRVREVLHALVVASASTGIGLERVVAAMQHD